MSVSFSSYMSSKPSAPSSKHRVRKAWSAELRATLGDGGLLGLDGAVQQRLFERHDRDLELVVVRLFGRDPLQPQAGLDQRTADGAVEMARREADDLVREAGDE